MLLALMDITERKRAEARLTFMAQHDGLTGLPNRNLLRQQMDEILLHTRRSARRSRCSCSTSTISSRSTIRSATASATSCCAASPNACARRCARRRAGAAQWRRIRHHADRAVASRGRRAAGAAPAGRHRRPYLLDGHSVVIGATRRHRHGARRRRRFREAAQECRHGAVARQERSRAAPSPSSRPAWMRAPRAAASSRSICATPSRMTCCSHSTSRWSTSRPAASPASRRWCAGRIRSAA